VSICGIYISLMIVSDKYILTEQFFYNNLSSQIPVTSIEKILESRKQLWWGAYLIQVIVVLFKVLFASICIFVGIILSDKQITFINLFNLVLLAELIFVIAQLTHLINLYLYRVELTFNTTANYFPGSMLSFLGAENVVPWLHYPLQTLNIFEVAYVLLISWLLSKQWKPDFVESLNIVIPSYGIGLILWMALVVFLTLQIT
jgi:hypothetical protein